MKLALSKIQGGDDNVILLTQNEVPDADIMKLLFHRIPISIPGEKLLEVIPGDFTVELKPNKKAGGDKYTALAVFKNKQEADDAFKGLVGDLAKDSSGRPQKLIYFKMDSGIAGSLYVRKMVQDGDKVQEVSNKRPFEFVTNCI